MAEKGSKLLQYKAVLAANLNTAACGAILGWTSPSLAKLSEDKPISADNPLGRPITKDEGSWVGSLVPLGIMSGSLFSGYLTERTGRKRALLISAILQIIGWVVLSSATSVHQIYVGRYILGVGISICFATMPMYTGEISDASVRGTLGTLMQVFVNLGILLSYSVGPYVSYKIFCFFCLSLYVIFFLCILFMPESPYYLISHGQELEAAQALAKFRGLKLYGVNKEIEEIKKEIDRAYSQKTTWRKALKNKVNRKTVAMMVCMMAFIELMGIDCVLFYVEIIFRNAGTRNTALSAIIVGLVQMLATVFTSVVVDRSGRKILLVISGIGAGISVGILGAYFYLQELQYDLSDVTWIPLVTLVIYVFFHSLGWGSLPWTMLSEIFSPAIKSKATSLSVLSINTFSFLMTKSFANVEQIFGAYVCFWIFAVWCLLGIIFVLSVVPETKGKTLAEIQNKLNIKAKNTKSAKMNMLTGNGDVGHVNLGLEI